MQGSPEKASRIGGTALCEWSPPPGGRRAGACAQELLLLLAPPAVPQGPAVALGVSSSEEWSQPGRAAVGARAADPAARACRAQALGDVLPDQSEAVSDSPG